MLFILYFAPCDLMHHHVTRLKPHFFSDERTRERIGQEFIAFTHYWLASLYVVVEGWKELQLRHPEIDRLIVEHEESLRRFRNAVYHFQLQDQKHRQFFEVAKFNWAEQLHSLLRSFFETKFA